MVLYFVIPELRSRSRKEPHYFGGTGAGAIKRRGSGPDGPGSELYIHNK
jgi:hypothetical protein